MLSEEDKMRLYVVLMIVMFAVVIVLSILTSSREEHIVEELKDVYVQKVVYYADSIYIDSRTDKYVYNNTTYMLRVGWSLLITSNGTFSVHGDYRELAGKRYTRIVIYELRENAFFGAAKIRYIKEAYPYDGFVRHYREKTWITDGIVIFLSILIGCELSLLIYLKMLMGGD